MQSQRVDPFDPLGDQLLVDAEHHRTRLLLGGLGFDKPHAGQYCRLDNVLRAAARRSTNSAYASDGSFVRRLTL